MCNFVKAYHDNIYSELGNIGKHIGISDKNIISQDCNIKLLSEDMRTMKLHINHFKEELQNVKTVVACSHEPRLKAG